MAKMGMGKGEPINHPWLNKSIEKAQKKVEERNFEIRKHLLEYDDVLNQQRKFIYEQRDAILEDNNLKQRVNSATNDIVASMFLTYKEDNNLKQRVNSATNDIVASMFLTYKENQKRDQVSAYRELGDTLNNSFAYTLKRDEDELKNIELLEKRVCLELEEDLEKKEQIIGAEYLNYFIRDQYLLVIDKKWLDHLENMEALREAVYLRSYAQKNPLTEYKVEGFQVFDTMIDDIRRIIAGRLHLVRIQTGENQYREERKTRSAIQVQNATHNSMDSFGAAVLRQQNTQAAAARTTQAARPQSGSVTVVRSQPKLGRNDPCYCGSGKKFKHCCGRN